MCRGGGDRGDLLSTSRLTDDLCILAIDGVCAIKLFILLCLPPLPPYAFFYVVWGELVNFLFTFSLTSCTTLILAPGNISATLGTRGFLEAWDARSTLSLISEAGVGDFELALRWSGTVGTRGFFFAGSSSWSPAFSFALLILVTSV